MKRYNDTISFVKRTRKMGKHKKQTLISWYIIWLSVECWMCTYVHYYIYVNCKEGRSKVLKVSLWRSNSSSSMWNEMKWQEYSIYMQHVKVLHAKHLFLNSVYFFLFSFWYNFRFYRILKSTSRRSRRLEGLKICYAKRKFPF